MMLGSDRGPWARLPLNPPMVSHGRGSPDYGSAAKLLMLSSLATITTTASALPYGWQIRPNIGDSYVSTYTPQPICGLQNGVAKIFIFSNLDYYKSQNLYNASSAVRVGVITTPADTYGLSPFSLPGKRYDFAVASVGNSTGTAHSFFLFGGRNAGGDLNDIWEFTSTGFSQVMNGSSPVLLPSPRSGVTAVPALGKIYLFGGHSGSSVLKEVWEFDPVTKALTQKPDMTVGLYSARAMTKSAPGNKNFIYLVGGKAIDGGGPTYDVYRYDAGPGTMIKVVSQATNLPLSIPNAPATPMATWDPGGNVRIVAAGGYGSSGAWSWGKMDAWTLVDQYSGAGNGKASLGAAPYNAPARARDMAGVVKCGQYTYLIGGNYGHGKSLQDRSQMVDRLGVSIIKIDLPAKATDGIRAQ